MKLARVYVFPIEEGRASAKGTSRCEEEAGIRRGMTQTRSRAIEQEKKEGFHRRITVKRANGDGAESGGWRAIAEREAASGGEEATQRGRDREKEIRKKVSARDTVIREAYGAIVSAGREEDGQVVTAKCLCLAKREYGGHVGRFITQLDLFFAATAQPCYRRCDWSSTTTTATITAAAMRTTVVARREGGRLPLGQRGCTAGNGNGNTDVDNEDDALP